MVDFIKALDDGQKIAPAMGYASVPAAVVQAETEQLNQIKLQ